MLRVIGGTHRSRKIKEVKNKTTRPTTDKNKEALFNIIGQYFDGGRMLDLFAGSGALGIEAISRGIEDVDFVEKDKDAVQTIEENLMTLKLLKHANIYEQDAFAFLTHCDKHYDLVIADPPYALDRYHELLDAIVAGQLVKDNGIIVFEAGKHQVLPEGTSPWTKYREKVMGQTKFGFYRKEESS